MNKFITFYSLSVFTLFTVNFASAQKMDEKSLYATNYGYVGLANTNTSFGDGRKLNGVGVIAGTQFSLFGYIGEDNLNRLVIADMTRFDIGIGGRSLNKSAKSNSLLDTAGAYFFFSLNFGLQAYYRITENIDFGGQIFYNANYDDARSPAVYGGSGNDDNLMFGLHARYGRFIAEVNTKVPNNKKDYQGNQYASFVKLTYVYDKDQ